MMNTPGSFRPWLARDIDKGLLSEAKFARLGLFFLTAGAFMLVGVGLAALLTAVSIILLPHEQSYLHHSAVQLHEHHHDATLVNFIIHNRVAFAGTLISIGWLYCWLTWRPIKNGKAWGWWALFLSCLFGGGSYFSFLSYGYRDPWHGMGTAVIMFALATGLVMSRPPTGNKNTRLRLVGWGMLRWPRTEVQPRLFFLIWAAATLLAGASILGLGMATVFVPQDLEYMQTTVIALQAIHAHLIPFIAHDRTGFGGALIAIGIVTCTAVWQSKTIFDRSLLIALSVVCLLDVITAIGIHFVVGYVSFMHLLPFLIKDIVFLIGLLLIFRTKGQPK